MMIMPKRRRMSVLSTTLLLLGLLCLPQYASCFLSSPQPHHNPRRIKGYRQPPSRRTLFATKNARDDASIIGININGFGAPVVIDTDPEHGNAVMGTPVVKKRAVKRKVGTKSTKVVKTSQTKTEEAPTEEDPTLTTVATKKKKARKGIAKESSTTATATQTPTKKLATRKKKKRSANTASSPDGDVDFWSSSTAPSATTNMMNQSHVICTVYGNPQPLRRHRTARGFMYNPSAAAQRCFQGVVQQVLGLTDSDDDYRATATKQKKNGKSLIPLYDGAHEMDDLVPTTHFGSDTLLHLHLVCYCRRPKNHFIASRPGEGRLKLDAPSQVQRRVDVDNLAKFVLDCLNGILYADDQQVVSLHCIKVYHDDEDFLGKSVLRITTINHDDLHVMTI